MMRKIRAIFALATILAAGMAYAGAPVDVDTGTTDKTAYCPPRC